MANIQLKKFDMTNIADDKVIVLIGKRETAFAWNRSGTRTGSFTVASA